MKRFDRRQFRKRGFCLFAPFWLNAQGSPAKLVNSDRSLRFAGENYVWEWSADDDHFRVLNGQGKTLASAPLQPVVLVQPSGQSARRVATPGVLDHHEVQGNRAVWLYKNVNGSGKLTVA